MRTVDYDPPADLEADGRVTRAVFFCLDCLGNHVACEDPDQIEELASDLEPGYRVVRIDVKAKPPRPVARAVAAVTVPDPPQDAAHGDPVFAGAASAEAAP